VQEAFDTLWTAHLWVCAAASADIPACVPDAAIMQAMSARMIFFALFISFPPIPVLSFCFIFPSYPCATPDGSARILAPVPFIRLPPFLYEKTAPALAGTVFPLIW